MMMVVVMMPPTVMVTGYHRGHLCRIASRVGNGVKSRLGKTSVRCPLKPDIHLLLSELYSFFDNEKI
jgi:hypothetical protein